MTTTRGTPAAPVDHDTWHQARLERLRAEDGWLTLVGLTWLPEGASTVGRDETATLSYAGFPIDDVGLFERSGDVVRFRPAEGVPVRGVVDPLRTDADEEATVLRLGSCSMYVIVRGDRYGVRLKDNDAPARKNFTGIERFPVSDGWRLEATFVPAAKGETISIANILGQESDEALAGHAQFTHDGQECRMVLMPGGDDDRFFVVFGDETSGDETYGGGRFLEAVRGDEGTVILDFNRAYNPPCVFTPYATCPLPVASNRLPFRVDAGERMWGEGH